MKAPSETPKLSRWEQRWLRHMHLRPTYVRDDDDWAVCIAISAPFYHKVVGRSPVPRSSPVIYYFVVESQQLLLNVHCRYIDRGWKLKPFSNAKIVNEMITGSKIAQAREMAEARYGRYEG